MHNILQIYQKYQIMPQLVEHQLKVAAVASLICGHFSGEINKEDVIKACLLHDMGNLIKYDLKVTQDLHPGMFNDKDIAFWQKVKEEFTAKYGKDAHHASMVITKEIGVGGRVTELVNAIGFVQGKANAASNDFNQKICAYSDMRVGPKGVMGLEERMADLRARYQGERALLPSLLAVEFEQALKTVEKQIFINTDITPEFINDGTIRPIVENLKKFSL